MSRRHLGFCPVGVGLLGIRGPSQLPLRELGGPCGQRCDRQEAHLEKCHLARVLSRGLTGQACLAQPVWLPPGHRRCSEGNIGATGTDRSGVLALPALSGVWLSSSLAFCPSGASETLDAEGCLLACPRKYLRKARYCRHRCHCSCFYAILETIAGVQRVLAG